MTTREKIVKVGSSVVALVLVVAGVVVAARVGGGGDNGSSSEIWKTISSPYEYKIGISFCDVVGQDLDQGYLLVLVV